MKKHHLEDKNIYTIALLDIALFEEKGKQDKLLQLTV